jgi:hypothetical protein
MQPNLDPPPPAGEEQGQAATLSQAETVISQAKETLAAQKKKTLTFSADPRVTQWKDCHFNEYANLLGFLGLPDTIIEARDQQPVKAAKILKHIEKCENELGALDIDVRHRTIQPVKAIAQTQKIIQEYNTHQNTIKKWQAQITLLTNADKTLRERLSVSGLLPFAKALGRRTSALVAEGYIFYRMIKDESGQSDTPTLHDYHAQAIDLEKRIRNIDLTGLSGLARTIIDHNLQVAVAATDQLKEFIEFFSKNLPGEVPVVDRVQQELVNLRDTPAPEVFAKIEPIATSLSRNLVGLRNKAQGMKQIQFLPIVLEETRTFHYTMKTTILPEIKRQISAPGSPVNPNTIAAEKTTDFFMGLKGFVRAVKLLFSAAGGQKAIKSEDLHHILLDLLNTCDTYYGNTKADIARLHKFIDAKLCAFEQPFPYDGLYQTAKEAIGAYGSRLEKLLFSFETTDYSTDDKDENPPRHTK